MNSRVYQVGRSTLAIIFGDIATSQAEAVVSSDDYALSMGGGVSAALSRAAGAEYRAQAQRIVRAHLRTRRRPSAGDVLVTSAGKLPAKYVLHAVTRGGGGGYLSDDAIVRHCCQRVMWLLPLLNCRSVALPSLGTGFTRIDPAVSAEQMAGAIVRRLLESEEPLRVELYLMDRRFNTGSAATFYETFENWVTQTLAVAVLERGEERELAAPTEEATHDGDREITRRFDIYTMLRRLDERRNEIDAAIHALAAGADADPAADLRRLLEQLELVARLRRIYEAELVLPAKGAKVVPRSVFLSSTWSDLREHRARARDAIERLGLPFIGMEAFPAGGAAPVDFIRQEVNRAAIYVGVLGLRYGSVDPALGFSMTELEYRQAVASRKPRCLFVMGDEAAISPAMVEKDPVSFARLAEFRDRVLKENVVVFFTDPDDLARQLDRSLRQSLRLDVP